MKFIVNEEVFNKALMLALRMPGVVVNRNAYLCRQLSKDFPQANLHDIVKDPVEFRKIDMYIRLKLARGSIKYHRYTVSGIAFGLGAPGLLALPFTIPADLAQFYYHTLVLMQKLLYLMGWPDLNIKDASVDDETLTYIKIFVGAMHGVHAARSVINAVSHEVSVQVMKRLPRIALTKTFIYNLTKVIARWLGVKITKQIFAKLVGRSIPIVGGVISGSITYAAFGSMSYDFLDYLSGLGIAKLQTGNLDNDNGVTDGEITIDQDEIPEIEKEIEKEIQVLDNELKKN